jgi:hypothetical protein
MRNRTVGTAALALALGVGAAAGARAAEPANNWFTRLFYTPPAARKDAAPAKDAQAESVIPPRIRQANAKADLIRRLEVCDKLRELAFQTGDDELLRKADRLEQRAWDVHARTTNTPAGLSADEAVLNDRLGPDAVGARSPLAGARTKTGDGRAAAGDER